MSRPLVILGSARPDGETRKAVELAFPGETCEIIILGDHAIEGYRYGQSARHDDFLSIVERMLAAKAIVFATPVYWYAMSGSLKTFFDRLTDLLEVAKSKGRALAGKQVWLIATGTENDLPAGFEVPFANTALYLAMQYQGAAYLYSGDDLQRRQMSESTLRDFGARILADVGGR